MWPNRKCEYWVQFSKEFLSHIIHYLWMISLPSMWSFSVLTILTLFFRELQSSGGFIIVLRDHTQFLNTFIDSWTFGYLAWIPLCSSRCHVTEPIHDVHMPWYLHAMPLDTPVSFLCVGIPGPSTAPGNVNTDWKRLRAVIKIFAKSKYPFHLENSSNLLTYCSINSYYQKDNFCQGHG